MTKNVKGHTKIHEDYIHSLPFITKHVILTQKEIKLLRGLTLHEPTACRIIISITFPGMEIRYRSVVWSSLTLYIEEYNIGQFLFNRDLPKLPRPLANCGELPSYNIC